MTGLNVRQTKFLLAAFLICMSTLMALVSMVAVLLGKPAFVTFEQWWLAGSTVLGLFGVAHVTDTHLQQKKQIAPENQTA